MFSTPKDGDKPRKKRVQLSFKSKLQLLEWVRKQPEAHFADRNKAAEVASSELEFPVSTFNLYAIQLEFPGCIDRIVKRLAPVRQAKSQGDSTLKKEIQELRDRVAALESLVEMIASGK